MQENNPIETKISDFAANREEIEANIAKAAKEAERDINDIVLVAVSKTQSHEKLQEALDAGQKVFGENRVQEAYEHWENVDRKGLELHLIGPLQTNKSDEAVKLFDVIETIDRENLCAALKKSIDKIGKTPRLFIQVNIGNEEQKAGVAIEKLPELLDIATNKYGLKIEGLMCIPPHDLPPAPFFALTQKLAKENGLKYLSMGMSADYDAAILFGANYVRVGTALFGARDYNN